MTEYLLIAALGGLIAFLFSIPALILEIVERGKVDRLPLLVDVKTILKRKLHKEEVFLVAVLLQILLGILFAIAYLWFTTNDWLIITNAPYSLQSFFVFSIFGFFVAGLVIFPVLRMGVFGKKEGKYVWLEMLSSFLLLGFSLWLAVQFYQPVYFVL